MKAIVFTQTGGPEVLALGDVPKPDVRPGMALIKIQAIGVIGDRCSAESPCSAEGLAKKR